MCYLFIDCTADVTVDIISLLSMTLEIHLPVPFVLVSHEPAISVALTTRHLAFFIGCAGQSLSAIPNAIMFPDGILEFWVIKSLTVVARRSDNDWLLFDSLSGFLNPWWSVFPTIIKQ